MKIVKSDKEPNNVITLAIPSTPDVDIYAEANLVLERCMGEYTSVVALGYDKDGRVFLNGSEDMNVGDILLLLEYCKKTIMDEFE